MGTTPRTHDVKITAGGTTKGFMLAKRDGRKMWSVEPMPALAQQQYTGELSYAQTPPEYELVLDQYDWSYGLVPAASRRKDGYYLGQNVDCRFPNRVMAGPAYVSTSNGAPSGTNMGFETWSGGLPTGWTIEAGLTVEEEATIFYAGTKSAKCTGNAGDIELLYQRPETTGRLKGSTCLLTVRVKATNANFARAYVDDGSGSVQYSSYHTGGGDWELLTVASYTVPNGATKLEIGIEFAAAANVAYIDSLTLTVGSMDTPAVVFAELSSQLYLATTKCIYKWNTSTSVWDAKLYVSGGAFSDLTCFNSQLFVALGASTAYQYSSDGDTWTACTLGDPYAEKFTVLKDALYKSVTNNIKLNADATNTGGPWSDATPIGDSTYSVNQLLVSNDELYIAKPDGLYRMDADGEPHVVSGFLRSLTNSNNGKQTREWHGRIYFPVNNSGLIYYDPENNVIANISPTRFSDSQYYAGNIVAMAGDSEWLYIVKDGAITANTDGLLAINKTGNWHGFLAEIPIDDVRVAHISSLQSTTNNRLWIAGQDVHNSNTNTPHYIILPTNYTDPDSDSNYTFAVSTSVGIRLYTTYFDGGLVASTKRLHKMGIAQSNRSAGVRAITATPTYDDGTQSDETFAFTGSSFYDEDSLTTPLSVKRVYVQLVWTNTAGSSSLILHSYALYTILTAHKKKIYRFGVRIANDIMRCDGVHDMETVTSLVAFLATAENVIGTLVDMEGTSHTVLFRPMRDDFIQEEPRREGERVFTIEAVEVS